MTTKTTCQKCSGSGEYHLQRYANGKPTVIIEACYACQGKGEQDASDRARNRVYWRHAVSRAMSCG